MFGKERTKSYCPCGKSFVLALKTVPALRQTVCSVGVKGLQRISEMERFSVSGWLRCT